MLTSRERSGSTLSGAPASITVSVSTATVPPAAATLRARATTRSSACTVSTVS